MTEEVIESLVRKMCEPNERRSGRWVEVEKSRMQEMRAVVSQLTCAWDAWANHVTLHLSIIGSIRDRYFKWSKTRWKGLFLLKGRLCR